MTRRGIFIAVMVMLVGCSPVVTPTVPPPTAIPTSTPIPSATPEPTPMPTPTLSPQDIRLDVTAERDRLAADGRSQMLVTVVIDAPTGIADLNGQTVFFTAQGGGLFSPTFAMIANNRATSTYLAGYAVGEQTVRLIANVDVAQVGRAQGEMTITLQNEQPEVLFPALCGYPQRYDDQITRIPLPFTLQTDFPDLNGLYGLRFDAVNGTVAESDVAIPSRFFTLTAPSGDNTVYFQFPPQQPVGGSQLCVAIADKDNIPPRCTAVLWGDGANRLSSLTRVDGFTRYYVPTRNEFPNTIVRVGTIGGNDASVYFGMAYEVVWGGEALTSSAIYTYEAERIGEKDCEVRSALNNRLDPFPYFLNQDVQTPLIVRWQASAVGRNDPLTFVGHTVIGSRALRIINRNIVMELADGATLTFMPNRFDADYQLFALYPENPTEEFVTVMALVYVPTQTIDSQTGMLMGDENQQIIVRSSDRFINANMLFMLQNPTFAVNYSDEYNMQALQNSNTINWQPVYVVGRVLNSSVQTATSNN